MAGVQIQVGLVQGTRLGRVRGVREKLVDDVLEEEIFLAQELQILGGGAL